MNDQDIRQKDIFPAWLNSLNSDAKVLLLALQNAELPVEMRRFLAGGINYFFKSLDLIPDGTQDIGYLDDAFILRLSARAALEAAPGGAEDASLGELKALAAQVKVIADFLGEELFSRIDRYARALIKGAARGRTVDDIVEQADVLQSLVAEAEAFLASYNPPQFLGDEKNLIKLKAFFDAKLPK